VAEIRFKFSRNQEKLYKFVGNGEYFKENLPFDDFNQQTVFEESTMAPFDFYDMSQEEVVVKVETVELDESCIKETELPEIEDIEEDLDTTKLHSKKDIIIKKKKALIGDRLCAICGKTCKSYGDYYKHVSSNLLLF
jgi:hypothetical protein